MPFDFSVDEEKTTDKVVQTIDSNPNILIEELAEMFDLTRDSVNWQIRKLKNKELLRHVGTDNGGYWEVINLLKKQIKCPQCLFHICKI